MTMKIIRALLLAFTPAFAVTLSAVTLVTWDFEGTTLANALASRTAVENLEASAVTHNNLNNVLRNTANYSTVAFTVSPATGQSSYDFVTAFANASYISFSVTVAEGYSLSLDSISLQAASGTTNSPDTSIRAFYVLSSFTGFAAETDRILLQDSVAGGLGSRATGLKDYSVTLTDPAFQSIAGGTTVEFRVYIQTATNTQNLDFDNFTISGTLNAIPEPSAAAFLAGIAVCGFACIRRRRPAA